MGLCILLLFRQTYFWTLCKQNFPQDRELEGHVMFMRIRGERRIISDDWKEGVPTGTNPA